MPTRGSETVTDGVRVHVEPIYMPEQSLPQSARYVFAYRVTITNDRADEVQVVAREWTIIDAHGRREQVRGPGVVGETPMLPPGQAFRYMSYCPLETPWGTMEGRYQMRAGDGTTFHVDIGRFYLTTLDAERGTTPRPRVAST